MYADAVIEGGGVKGIGLVGAIYEAEKRGYQWRRLAGTSAGALIAAFLAAGYSAEELKAEIINLDYIRFLEKKGIQKLPFAGNVLSLILYNGIYSGDFLENWIKEKLLVKGVRTFGDLDNKKLSIIASDITSGKMMVLPNDLVQYGIDPNTFNISTAVRMSTSLPYFFQPKHLTIDDHGNKKVHYIVDGGILSNFPVWIFDKDHSPRWPTFGFRLVSSQIETSHQIKGPLSFTKAIIGTMLEAHDERHIKEEDYVRTILVPTLGINTTDFHISKEESQSLFMAGKEAGERFFDKWSFHRYVALYRSEKKNSLKKP